MKKRFAVPLLLSLVILLAVGLFAQPAATPAPKPASGPKATAAEAEKFIDQAESALSDWALKLSRAAWVNATYITDDTDAINADYFERFTGYQTELALKIRRYEGVKLSPVYARKFLLLKLQLFSLTDAKERAEHATLGTELQSEYGKGKYCPTSGKWAGKCLAISEIEQVMASSRDPEELKEVWMGWNAISRTMRNTADGKHPYARFIELENKGAQGLGYKDMGDYWRAGYDMPPEAFAAELERLWQQVRPLYESLHAYVRVQLVKQYGPQAVTKDGLIRSDLLGNIWAQDWTNVYPLVAPKDSKGTGYDLTEILKEKKIDELGMVHYAENFFKSLGFEPLPQTFWERSLFLRPKDRDVVCHASAWDVDNQDDLRLKMCILVRDEDFVTCHHELGHNFYQRAYKKQPFLFEGGANDGFHEAIGDTIALSVTPEYLKQVGLLEKVPDSDDTALLLHKALEKVAFLPFGMMIDQWRWKVFSGEIKPDEYEKGWNDLRAKYQGIIPPVARTENDFDPGAKYHVAGNVPYMRYFLADILQFQFYRAMCKEAGFTGPLHHCSFYNNKQAGAKFAAMLQMGQSRPWPEALKALTGEDKMDANAIMDYFAPLKKWLDEQNAAARVKPGWTVPANPSAGPQ